MDDSISAFCGAMSTFLSHLQSSSDALAESLRRRPIPLDSAAASFMQRLGHRVDTAEADLELLEDMAMGTVSVAELLGHCSEVYRRNQTYVGLLQDHLAGFGYVPADLDNDDDDESVGFIGDSIFIGPAIGLEKTRRCCGAASAARSAWRGLDEDLLFEDSISLENITLWDASLASLGSQAKDDLGSRRMHSEDLVCSKDGETCENKTLQHSTEVLGPKGMLQAELILNKDARSTPIEISKDDYDKLPMYVKSLASWEDLEEAVTRMNSELHKRDISKGSCSFSGDDLEALGLGRKGKSYLLALIRMNRLAVETVDGSVVYRIV